MHVTTCANTQTHGTVLATFTEAHCGAPEIFVYLPHPHPEVDIFIY